jgi:hypothetical protein
MDAPAPLPWLYDPAGSAAVVRAHRPAGGGAATCVVSDALWGDVLCLVRWAHAALAGPVGLRAGTAWRTAAASAALLHRLPALCDELGECWRVPAVEPPTGGPAAARLRSSTDQLALRLRAPADRTPLCVLAAEVDEVGAAAVAVLAEGADWAGSA